MKNKKDTFVANLKAVVENEKSPINKEEIWVEYRNKIAIHDIAYDGVSQEKIRAYLVEPYGEGPFAGVIYVHPSPGNRETFLEEAVEMAEKNNIASLVIEAPWASDEYVPKLMELFHGGLREWYSQIVIDLKRGIDLLASFSWVDSKRLGYVGHSFGALFGGILVGIDSRIKTYILMAGVGSFTDVALLNMPDLAGEELENFSKMMDPIDPIHYITQASSASLFFQFGRQDDFYPEKRFLEYYELAGGQKKMEWYDADHYLNEDALNDRIDWLVLKLNQTDNIEDSLKLIWGISLILQIDNNKNVEKPIPEYTFSELDIKEREHIEEWIEEYPEMLGEELLIIAKEYDAFDKTNNRLDLLAIDKNGKLVIIELKGYC